jgi:hypothetical protein
MFASPAAQIETLSAGAMSLLARLNPFAAPPGAKVAVTSGFHEGSTKAFTQNTICIGSGAGADLVLLDPEIVEKHCSLQVQHSLLGVVVAVTAHAGGVQIGDIRLDPGLTSRQFRLPVDITIGMSVGLRLGNAHRLKPQRNWLQRTLTTLWRAACLMILAIGCIVAFSMLWGQRFALQTEPLLAAESDVVMHAVDQDMIVAKLQELGLGQALTVAVQPDGLFEISGNLATDQVAAWEQLHVWYDSQSGGRPLRTQLNIGTVLPEMPPISMVRLHEPRALILATGDTIAPGERIGGDWRLIAIETDHIEIGLGDVRQIIPFAEPGQ